MFSAELPSRLLQEYGVVRYSLQHRVLSSSLHGCKVSVSCALLCRSLSATSQEAEVDMGSRIEGDMVVLLCRLLSSTSQVAVAA